MIRSAGRYIAVGTAAAIVGAVLLARMAFGAWRDWREESAPKTGRRTPEAKRDPFTGRPEDRPN